MLCAVPRRFAIDNSKVHGSPDPVRGMILRPDGFFAKGRWYWFMGLFHRTSLADSGVESHCCTTFRFGSLFLSILRRRVRFQRAAKASRALGLPQIANQLSEHMRLFGSGATVGIKSLIHCQQGQRHASSSVSTRSRFSSTATSWSSECWRTTSASDGSAGSCTQTKRPPRRGQ